ncbi:MAG: zinc ribbon domain-containing protein [Elusimicrobia bacterium]|nr:zinc ribbon domain-containing protein [Elusimicrobiota bacterium]
MAGTCPNCKAEQPEGATECPQCGIVYVKFLKRQAEKNLDAMAQAETAQAASAAPSASTAAGAPGGSSPAPDPEKGGPGGVLAAVGLIAGLGAGGWFMYPGKGLPVTDAMQKSAGHAFAAAAPTGFTANWTEQIQGAGVIPAQFANTTVGSFSGTFADGYAPNMTIVSMPLPPSKVTPANKDKQAETRFADIRASVDKWTPESVQVVKVDKLDSLRVEGGGPKHVKQVIPPVVMNRQAAAALERQKNPGAIVFTCKVFVDIGRIGPTPDACIVEDARTLEADYELLTGGVLVPGKKRQYLLSYVCDRNQRTACMAAFDELVGSFRVLERPGRMDFVKPKG